MGFFNFGNKEKREEIIVTPQVTPEEPSATSAIFKALLAEGASTSLSAFFGCTELISNSIAQLPILVKNNNVIDPSHNINFLFKDMLITKFVFIKKMVTDVIINGNAFAYIERAGDGTPVNLIYCENGSVNIHYNKYKQELYYTISDVAKKMKIEPINVIHLYKNTKDGIEGTSIPAYAKQVLDLAKQTQKAAQQYYSSGCALQGALTLKGARRGAKEAARQAFMDTHSGKGSGLVILDDDMTYTPLSSNASESQMLEARSYNVAEICRFFNINPVLLGDPQGKTYSTLEDANREFIFHTLSPWVTMIEEEFNRKLVKPSEQGYIRIDLDEKYLLKGDTKSTSEYLSKLVSTGILTINEARHYLDLQPVKGGDEVHIAYTDVNQNKLTDKPNGETI